VPVKDLTLLGESEPAGGPQSSDVPSSLSKEVICGSRQPGRAEPPRGGRQRSRFNDACESQARARKFIGQPSAFLRLLQHQLATGQPAAFASALVAWSEGGHDHE
jgi:hypothetical protein